MSAMSEDELRLLSRIGKIRLWFRANPSSSVPRRIPNSELCLHPIDEYQIEPLAIETTKHLEQLEYYPRDMLLLLKEIGNMSSWGYEGRHVFNWWMPCDIATAVKENRSIYFDGIEPELFSKHNNLLFIGGDCDPNLYFYDTTIIPWQLVSCDGLDLMDHAPPFNGQIAPVMSGYPDVLSIIEEEIAGIEKSKRREF
jgi:hypothetical protein